MSREAERPPLDISNEALAEALSFTMQAVVTICTAIGREGARLEGIRAMLGESGLRVDPELAATASALLSAQANGRELIEEAMRALRERVPDAPRPRPQLTIVRGASE